MRSEWVPLSASALVTGAMALVLAQMLNPSSSDSSVATVLLTAGESSGQWLAISVLFFGAAVGLVLGLPCILSLFVGKGRRLAHVGVGVFSIGAIGLTGFSALMLMFRALAVNDAVDPALIDDVINDAGVKTMLLVWTFGFLGGVALIALALFRSKSTPVWVPAMLAAFLAVQLIPDSAGNLIATLGLVAFAAGLTGIATTATSPKPGAGRRLVSSP